MTVSELLEKILPISNADDEVEVIFEGHTNDGGYIRFRTKNITLGSEQGKIIILGYTHEGDTQ